MQENHDNLDNQKQPNLYENNEQPGINVNNEQPNLNVNREEPKLNTNKDAENKGDRYFARKNSPDNNNNDNKLPAKKSQGPIPRHDVDNPQGRKHANLASKEGDEKAKYDPLNEKRKPRKQQKKGDNSDAVPANNSKEDIKKHNKNNDDVNKKSKKGNVLQRNSTFGRLRNGVKKVLGNGNEEAEEPGNNLSQEAGDTLIRYNPFSFVLRILSFKVILIVSIAFFIIFVVCNFLFILFSSSKDGQEPSIYGPGESSCVRTMNADTSNQSEARFTHYFTIEYKSDGTPVEQYSLGAVGDIRNHIRVGNARFNEDGYAIWKGGSEYNGKKYGIDGIDYYIVATANKKVVGTCAGKNCQQKYQENNDIKYFEYGDTFSLGVTKQNGEEEVINAIVLDSCGACMDWALSSTGVYRPHSEAEIQKCKRSSGYKIDFYAHLQSDTKGFKDMGYIMGGVTSNTCVGQVDLGELVTGTDDTKQLQNLSLNTLLGAEGIAEVNRQIEDNVNKYGSGTGNGVAAAAITLLNSLKQKGYRLPYRWGGGHGTIDVGINGNWGTYIGPSPSPHTSFYYDSLDCSGFVSWAIRNGGCTNYTVGQGTGVLYNYGALEGKNDAKPGDILIRRSNNSGHVLLVVQNNAGSVILAESGVRGIVFSDYNEANHSSYRFRDMTSFYESTSCK